jgi:NADH-quinone oxidoreductase subunit C
MKGKHEQLIGALKKKFGNHILEVRARNDNRVDVSIPGEALTQMARYFYEDLQLRFIIASALESKKGYEIYYHFSEDGSGLILSLHVILPREKPEISSLTPLFEAANWIEREMREILGIEFPGHPNPEKLISEGNWAEGIYPLRKEE